VRLVQALMHRPTREGEALLIRNGFQSVTDLVTLARDLDDPIAETTVDSLSYEPYNPDQPVAFEKTLQATYEGSLDCPEVNGLRTIAEVIAGHQSQGKYEPANWWLVRRGGEPVGVVVQIDHLLSEEREVGYLGVIPTVRGYGIAGAIMERILRTARAARMARVILGVDARNRPALNLYSRWGFEEVDRQRVFLRLDL
jgi:ribosomal protein S18 acetylase RimI-like enzyme